MHHYFILLAINLEATNAIFFIHFIFTCFKSVVIYRLNGYVTFFDFLLHL